MVGVRIGIAGDLVCVLLMLLLQTMLALPTFVSVLAMAALIVVLYKTLIDGTLSARRPAWTGNSAADESPARSRLHETPLARRARPEPGQESASRPTTSASVQGPDRRLHLFKGLISDGLSSSSSLTLPSSSPGGPAIIDGPGEELSPGLEKNPPRTPRWRAPLWAQAKTADTPRSEREWAMWAKSADIVASPPGQTTPVPKRLE